MELTHVQDQALSLRLPHREPFDWHAIVGFLGQRALPGVEVVTPSAYRRTVSLGDVTGVLEVACTPGTPALTLNLRGAGSSLPFDVVERVRRLFDLRADPGPIAAHLRQSPALAALVRARPGLRVPGAWDAFEVAVRAVLGQQVSVQSARTVCGRLVATFGRRVDGGDPQLSHLFPTAEALAEADPSRFGLPRARAATLRGLARAVADRSLVLDGSRGLDDVVQRLLALPGIGPWTAHYIAMRAFGEPDAFPTGDLALRKAVSSGNTLVSAETLSTMAEAWRPWRAYAAVHLWHSLQVPGGAA